MLIGASLRQCLMWSKFGTLSHVRFSSVEAYWSGKTYQTLMFSYIESIMFIQFQ